MSLLKQAEELAVLQKERATTLKAEMAEAKEKQRIILSQKGNDRVLAAFSDFEGERKIIRDSSNEYGQYCCIQVDDLIFYITYELDQVPDYGNVNEWHVSLFGYGNMRRVSIPVCYSEISLKAPSIGEIAAALGSEHAKGVTFDAEQVKAHL